MGCSGGDQQEACYHGDEHLDQTDGLSCTHSRGKTSECGDHEESLCRSEVIRVFQRWINNNSITSSSITLVHSYVCMYIVDNHESG